MPKPRKRSRSTEPADPSRRLFIGGVLATSTLAHFGVTAAAGQVKAASAFKVLTHREGALLHSVLNRLIPREGQMPGAGDVGIAAYIDDVMIEAPHLSDHVREVLNAVHDNQSAATPDALDRELKRIQGERPDAFDSLLHATYTGYYSHPDVLTLVNDRAPSAKTTTAVRS